MRYALWTGAALLDFSGCAEVPVVENGAPATSKATFSSVKFNNRGEMIAYCKGMIAEKVGTKPMYVTMGGMDTDKVDGSSYISGTVDKIHYTCQFDKQNNFVHVSEFAN